MKIDRIAAFTFPNISRFCPLIIQVTMRTCGCGFWLLKKSSTGLNCDSVYLKCCNPAVIPRKPLFGG